MYTTWKACLYKNVSLFGRHTVTYSGVNMLKKALAVSVAWSLTQRLPSWQVTRIFPSSPSEVGGRLEKHTENQIVWQGPVDRDGLATLALLQASNMVGGLVCKHPSYLLGLRSAPDWCHNDLSDVSLQRALLAPPLQIEAARSEPGVGRSVGQAGRQSGRESQQPIRRFITRGRGRALLSCSDSHWGNSKRPKWSIALPRLSSSVSQSLTAPSLPSFAGGQQLLPHSPSSSTSSTNKRRRRRRRPTPLGGSLVCGSGCPPPPHPCLSSSPSTAVVSSTAPPSQLV